MNKLYPAEYIQARINEIHIDDHDDNSNVSMIKCFTDPTYRKATLVGIVLASL